MDEDTNHLMTEAEAAAFLNLSAQTLRNKRCASYRGPRIPWRSIGRQVRYHRGDLAVYLNEGVHWIERTRGPEFAVQLEFVL